MAGAIGPCSSLRRSGNNVAETAVGEGGTNAWSMGGAWRACVSALLLDVCIVIQRMKREREIVCARVPRACLCCKNVPRSRPHSDCHTDDPVPPLPSHPLTLSPPIPSPTTQASTPP